MNRLSLLVATARRHGVRQIAGVALARGRRWLDALRPGPTLDVAAMLRPRSILDWQMLRALETAEPGDAVAHAAFTRLRAAISTVVPRTREHDLGSYRAHYHDELPALLRADASCSSAVHEFVKAWCATPHGLGTAAWAPFPTATRAVNWIRAAALMDEGARERFLGAVAPALQVHARRLEARLERYLGGNHLIRELLALLFIELLVDTGHGLSVADRAAALLHEAQSQVLDDGMHYERSPMYHAEVLWDLCLAAAAAPALPSNKELCALIGRMASCLVAVVRPDGTYAHFNDSTEGLAPPAAKVLSASRHVAGGPEPQGSSAILLRPDASGYLVISNRDGWLMADLGALSPDLVPGHYHDDGLSFEFAYGGRLLVVNLGLRGYAGDPLRHFSRTVAAHSTVDMGVGQGIAWGVFRVAAFPVFTCAEVHETADEIRAGATLYPSQRPEWSHTRRFGWHTGPGILLTVEDEVSGPSDPVSYLHLAPGVTAIPRDWGLELGLEGLRVDVLLDGLSVREIVCAGTDGRGVYFPTCGQQLETRTVVLGFTSSAEIRRGSMTFRESR